MNLRTLLKKKYGRINLLIKKSEKNPFDIFPIHLEKLLSLKDFELIKKDTEKLQSMKRGLVLTKEEGKIVANYHGAKFVGSLIVLSNHWFFVTSLDIFIHNNINSDDCADDSKVMYQDEPIAYIRRKTQFKIEYFELSIRIGEVEMLANGGFWGGFE